MDSEKAGGAGRPPSAKAADPWGWAKAASGMGAVAGVAALALSWRPLPLLGAPPFALADQLGCWMASALHAAFGAGFAGWDRSCAAAAAAIPDAARTGVAVRAGIALAVSAAAAALLWKPFMAPKDRLAHVRGARRHEPPGAEALLRARLASEWKASPDHDLGGVPFPGDRFSQHILIAAGTGSGKSSAVLMPLIRDIVAADEALLLFDPKGEFTKAFKEPILLAPWDARSWAWDIAADMRNFADARRFAASIIPEDKHAPMWSNASRLVLAGSVWSLRLEHGAAWGWPELAERLQLPAAQLAPAIAGCMPEAARVISGSGATTQSVMATLSAHAAPIADLARAWGAAPPGRRVSARAWALGESGPRQIILQGHGLYPELTRAFCAGFIEVFSGLAASPDMPDSRTRKVWAIFDECPQLGPVPLRRLYELGRARGIRCVAAFQDFAQMEEVHGRLLMDALGSMVGTVLAGRMRTGESAERLAKWLGSREVERLNASWRGGSKEPPTLSWSREASQLYLPSELSTRLGKVRGEDKFVFAVAIDDVYEIAFPRVAFPDARPDVVPADWTLGRHDIDP